jgi:hypothetical protein
MKRRLSSVDRQTLPLLKPDGSSYSRQLNQFKLDEAGVK